MISQEQFEERQKRLNLKFTGARKGEVDHLFTKFIRCADCGRILTGEYANRTTKESYVYYSHKCGDKNQRIKVRVSERDILEKLHCHFNNLFDEIPTRNDMKQALKDALSKVDAAIIKEQEEIKKGIASLTGKKTRLYDLYADGSIPDKDILIKNQ